MEWKILKRNNHKGIAEKRERDRSNSREKITQEIVIETTTEVDQTQEKIEITNKGQVQVRDIMIEKISVTTVVEQVIQHIGFSNLRTI